MANKSAKKALEQFKMQAANEVGVTLNNNGYNGDLTSRQAGSIGTCLPPLPGKSFCGC